MNSAYLHIVQIAVALVLIVAVLLQGGGTGFSGMLSGGESFRTRRGAERFLFFATIAAAIVFVLVILIDLLI